MIQNNNMKKFTISIIIIIILMICFITTTFALINNKVTVEDNEFQTGIVDIQISELEPIYSKEFDPQYSDMEPSELENYNKFLFEPGMLVAYSFSITNNSTTDVYYRLYLDIQEDEETDEPGEIDTGLADLLEVTVTIDDEDDNSDNDTILFSNAIASNLSKDSINDFIKDNPNSIDELEEGKSKSYKIYFHYPSDSGNVGQDKSLSFKLSVEATQTKNNTDKEFNS